MTDQQTPTRAEVKAERERVEKELEGRFLVLPESPEGQYLDALRRAEKRLAAEEAAHLPADRHVLPTETPHPSPCVHLLALRRVEAEREGLRERVRELEAEIEAAHKEADEYAPRQRKCVGYPLMTLPERVRDLSIQLGNFIHRHRLRQQEEFERQLDSRNARVCRSDDPPPPI